MRVTLVHYLPLNIEEFISSIMRRTRDPREIEELKESVQSRDGWVERLVKLAVDSSFSPNSGHYSVLEHVVYTFEASEVSRVLTHQLVRHRVASYVQLSGRVHNSRKMIVPPCDYLDAEARTKARSIFSEIEQLAAEKYGRLLELGVRVEDARYGLPFGQDTIIIITMNARSLMHFLRLRMSPYAQWEIRELASKMYELVKPTAPLLWEKIPNDI